MWFTQATGQYPLSGSGATRRGRMPSVALLREELLDMYVWFINFVSFCPLLILHGFGLITPFETDHRNSVFVSSTSQKRINKCHEESQLVYFIIDPTLPY